MMSGALSENKIRQRTLMPWMKTESEKKKNMTATMPLPQISTGL